MPLPSVIIINITLWGKKESTHRCMVDATVELRYGTDL